MDQHAKELAMAGGKITVGIGPTAYGFLTLDNLALIFGILCSLAVTGHTLWQWWCAAKDRKARQAADA
jgi:hypothetical protein